MDLLSFIRTADPTKVRIGEKERDEDEPKLLETIVGRVVSLLPVALDRFSVNVIAEAVVEDVAPAELQRKKKRKTKVVDAGEPSHPAKKLRGDYGVSGEPTVGGKSYTPERRGGDHAEFLAGANLRTLEAPQRFVISSDSSDHSGANIAEAEVNSIVKTFVPIMTSATTATPTVDPAATANERLIGSSVFGGDSSSAGGSHPNYGGFSDRTCSNFLVSARQISLSAEVRMRVEYNIKEKRRLKSVVEEKDVLLKSMCDEIKSLKAQLIVKEAEAAKVVRLRDKTQNLKERNINLEKEKSELEVKVTDLAASVKVREQEVADLDVVVTSVKLQNDSLVDQVHELEASSAGLQEKVTVYENCMSQLEKFQDEKMKEVNEKFDKLCIDFVDMTLHLEENFYLHLLSTISGRRIICWYYPWCGDRTLTDVAVYKPSAEADYLSALQRLQSVNFPLIAELKANKDASVEVIMNLLRLEDALAENLGLVESQPHVDQLMVPIYHSPYQHVFGASSLSLSLDVSSAEGTSGVAPDTTTALSVTSISISTIPPISTDDYEIAHTEGGEGAVADVKAIVDEGNDPFLDVSGAELDVLE
nr:hypothetical protein [Tanacetum cinerariifolium]